MAQPRAAAAPIEMPGWQKLTALVSAVLLALMFLVAGIWKITDPLGTATRMNQALVPASLSLAAALAFGIAETFSGVLLLVPRFRRWGAIITGLLLIAFMVYIGWNYNALRGADCSCFPWLKRAVGPGFFISDAAMLALAVFAGLWTEPSWNKKGAVLILGAVAVFAGVSYGVTAAQQKGVKAPDTIAINGQPVSLQQGRFLIYFFDPECMHCDAAARDMAKMSFKDVRIVSIPTRVPQFAQEFLTSTGLKSDLSNDLEPMKKTFPFVDPPFAVALVNGHQVDSVRAFDHGDAAQTLKKIGFIE